MVNRYNSHIFFDLFHNTLVRLGFKIYFQTKEGK